MNKQTNPRDDFFVILSPMRCRSTYLGSLLNSHPQVVCHNEVFHQDESNLLFPQTKKNQQLFDSQWRNQHPALFLERMIEESKRYAKNSLVGCKLVFNDFQMQHGLDALLALQPRVIYLHRENKLAWYSSLKIARETGSWVSTQRSVQQHQTVFDKEDYQLEIAALAAIEKNVFELFAKHNIEYTTFEYDEVVETKTINQVLKFLRLPPASNLASPVERQNSLNILDRFANPDDVFTFADSIGQLSWLGISKEDYQKDASAAGQQTTATRQRITSLESQSYNLEKEVAHLNKQLTEAQTLIKSYETSSSWRLTKPLRMLGRLAKKTLRLHIKQA